MNKCLRKYSYSAHLLATILKGSSPGVQDQLDVHDVGQKRNAGKTVLPILFHQGKRKPSPALGTAESWSTLLHSKATPPLSLLAFMGNIKLMRKQDHSGKILWNMKTHHVEILSNLIGKKKKFLNSMKKIFIYFISYIVHNFKAIHSHSKTENSTKYLSIKNSKQWLLSKCF